MKKLLTLALVLLTYGAVGQISGGVKAGVNVSNFTGATFQNATQKALIGYHAGGLLNFKLGAVALQPELLVSASGAKIERSGLTQNYKLTYATIPVMVQLDLGGFYLEGGPQLGFKISESIPDQTIENFGKGLDLAAGVGLGYRSSMGLGFGLRYLVGLSKVGDFNPTTQQNPDFKHSTIQAGIFLMVGGKKKD
ncbi:MAG TPA: porin family protein [Lacibacter sp.]|nr:porin family protein [Lacibacter sp.]HMO90169.1 porin family protein [Lacibacter sp.]HMP86084.1 porin family protein [Lacibacter sp.]